MQLSIGAPEGTKKIAFPLITSLRQGSGWQARINADWMLHNPRPSAKSAEKCSEKIVAVTQNPEAGCMGSDASAQTSESKTKLSVPSCRPL
jgi:hypothetical protein